jgi:hypothetical protein
MTLQTKTTLKNEINSHFADNTMGAIQPSDLRIVDTDQVDSYQQAPTVNSVSGTIYTLAVDDYGKLVIFTNNSGCSVTLASASTSGFSPWNVWVSNFGSGTVTVTPGVPSVIGGNTSLVLHQGQTQHIISDGTNYQLAQNASAARALSVNVIVKTAVGTSTYTPSVGLNFAVVECVGGGGGGAGTVSSSLNGQQLNGGGGGAGGYSRKTLTAAAIGSSQTVTVGNFGSGSVGNVAAGAGTASSFGSLCVANGGGGAGPAPTFSNGGAGGSVTGAVGDIVAAGTPGFAGGGSNSNSIYFLLGSGGSSYFGGGAAQPPIPTHGSYNGPNGGNYGAGGAGGMIFSDGTATGSSNGGNGSAGVVIITEYIGGN